MRSLTTTVATALLVLLTTATTPAPSTAARSGPPTGGFTTGDGAVLLGVPGDAPAEAAPTAVTGWARASTPVRKVRVLWCPGSRQGDGYQCGSTPSLGELRVSRAELACRPSGRRCDWRSAAPSTPGRYVVVATVVDERGQRRALGPIDVTVL